MNDLILCNSAVDETLKKANLTTSKSEDTKRTALLINDILLQNLDQVVQGNDRR